MTQNNLYYRELRPSLLGVKGRAVTSRTMDEYIGSGQGADPGYEMLLPVYFIPEGDIVGEDKSIRPSGNSGIRVMGRGIYRLDLSVQFSSSTPLAAAARFKVEVFNATSGQSVLELIDIYPALTTGYTTKTLSGHSIFSLLQQFGLYELYVAMPPELSLGALVNFTISTCE